MYAVIETGGKQYRVSPEQTVEVETLPGEVGASVSKPNNCSEGNHFPQKTVKLRRACSGSARLAAADTHEVGARVIARCLASGDFVVGLGIGHARLDFL